MNRDGILEALETNIREKLRYFASKFYTMETEELEGGSVVDTGISSNALNTAYGGDISKSTAEEVYNNCKDNDQPASWWIGPSSGTGKENEELEEADFSHGEHEVGMACDLESLSTFFTKPSELSIRQCSTRQQFKDFGKVLASVTDLEEEQVKLFYELVAQLSPYQRREILFFVGYAKKQPVATSCLFLTDVAGIYDLATKPEKRNMGYGTALFYHALKEAKKRGFKTAVLQATKDGLNIYEKFGFFKICDFNAYTLT